MRYAGLFLLAVGLAFAAGTGAAYLQTPAPQHLPADAAAAGAEVRLLEAEAAGEFLLRVDAEIDPTRADAAEPWARLYFDVADKGNYAAVEARPGHLRLLRAEEGVCRVRAEAAIPPLASNQPFPARVEIRRAEPRVEVLCESNLVLAATLPPATGRRVGVSASAGVRLGEPRLQELTPIVFTDDFMRQPSDAGAWRGSAGSSWEVRSLDNPARSSNAFIFQGHARGGGYALVGKPYWRDYRVGVSALGPPEGTLGLVLAATGEEGTTPERCCLFRWESRPAAAEGEAGATAPRMTLTLRQGSKEITLAEKTGGYRPGEWYRLEAVLGGGRAAVLVDGRPLLAGRDPALCAGRAGLYIRSEEPAEFDDFRVESAARFEPAAIGRAAWRFDGPEWIRRPTGLLAPSSARALRVFAVTGRGDEADVEVRATVKNTADAPCGLVAAYRDPAHYVALMRDPRTRTDRLIRVEDGEETVLDEGPLPNEAGRLRLRLDRGVVRTGSGLAAFLPDLGGGLVGLLSRPDAPSREREAARMLFETFSAQEVETLRPADSANEIFREERLMALWSGERGDWREATAKGGYDQLWWHRARLAGDMEMEALLPEERRENWLAALSLAKPFSTQRKQNGYVLRLARAGKETKLELIRRGETVAAAALDPEAVPLRLRFRRDGEFLLGYVDDRPLLHWRDPDPLDGPKAAYAARGLALEPERLRVYSRSHLRYSFNSAPVDWRAAGGIWQVTNRWECDPRWSFMAGMPPFLAERRAKALDKVLTPEAKWTIRNLQDQLALVPDPESKLAGLWHKQSFPGDVVVEVFLAPMMDYARGGGAYHKYAQNFCITLSGDGRSLDSGYSCLFGGWENTKSAIVRGRTVLEETSQAFPKKGYIHHMWFRVRAERRGDRLFFSAYTQDSREAPERCVLSIAAVDEDPLPGDRVAIWTYNCGMLVARARISGAEPGGRESPLEDWPAPARTIYEDGETK